MDILLDFIISMNCLDGIVIAYAHTHSRLSSAPNLTRLELFQACIDFYISHMVLFVNAWCSAHY